MRRTLTLIVCLVVYNAYPASDTLKKQNSFSIGFSVSNNGQIQEHVLDNFYNRNWTTWTSTGSYAFGNAGNEYGTEIKPWRTYINWNVRLQYNLTHQEISFGLNAAYQHMYEAFQYVSRDSFANSIEQKILCISLFAQKNFKLKKLVFSTGFEIPYYVLGKHIERSRDACWSVFVPSPYREDASFTTPGGFVTGLNLAFTVSYNVCKWFSVYAHTSFGLLYAQAGGDIKREYSIHDYVTGVQGPTYTFIDPPRKMKRWFFSAPLVGMGVMVTL